MFTLAESHQGECIHLYAQYANPFSDATKTNALSTVTPSTAKMAMMMMIEKMMVMVNFMGVIVMANANRNDSLKKAE